MSKVPIYVLTLPGADKRQNYIRQQFSGSNLNFSFHYGVNGSHERTECWAFYDDDLRIRTKGYSLREEELGCFSSHYQLWVKCYLEKIPIIVLEDDVTIDMERLSRFISEAETIPKYLECVRLFKNHTKNHKNFTALQLNGDQKIEIYSKGPMSAMGYYLTPAGAKRLLKKVSPITQAVDIYMDSYWLHGVISAGIKPSVVHHEYIFDSIIGERPRGKKGFWAYINKEIYNFFIRVKREFHYIKLKYIARI